MHMINWRIVLSVWMENLPLRVLVSVNRVVQENNKWAQHANNVVRVGLAPVKPILNAFTAPRVLSGPNRNAVLFAVFAWRISSVNGSNVL